MKKLLCLLSLFTISATMVFAESFNEKMLNSWVGYSINDVIDRWGFPTKEKTIADRHVYIWTKSRKVYVPRNSYGTTYKYGNVSSRNSSSSGGYYETYSCTRSFEVDKDNMIINGFYEGNDCFSTYLLGKKLVNPQNDLWQKKQEQKAKEKFEKQKNRPI